MKQFLKRRPSAALIVAVVALVAALGGTAVAGNFVTKTKFKKFKQSTNSTLSTTLKGPVNYVTVAANNPAGATTDIAASCPGGTTVLGGGIKVENDNTQLVNDSHPTSFGWAGTVKSTAAINHTAQITAICATGGSTGTRPSS